MSKPTPLVLLARQAQMTNDSGYAAPWQDWPLDKECEPKVGRWNVSYRDLYTYEQVQADVVGRLRQALPSRKTVPATDSLCAIAVALKEGTVAGHNACLDEIAGALPAVESALPPPSPTLIDAIQAWEAMGGNPACRPAQSEMVEAMRALAGIARDQAEGNQAWWTVRYKDGSLGVYAQVDKQHALAQARTAQAVTLYGELDAPSVRALVLGWEPVQAAERKTA